MIDVSGMSEIRWTINLLLTRLTIHT